MVIRRIITGVLIAIFVAFIIWFGEPWFTIAACMVAAVATFEFYRMVKTEYVQPLSYFGIACSVIFIANAYYIAYAPSPYPCTFSILFASITVIPLIWVLFRRNKDNSFINWGWTLAGILYIGWLMSFYVLIRSMENGIGWVLLVLSCTALCDVFAYAVGSTVGKHPLAASVSPGKTWEGAAGGLAASIVFALIVSTLFNLPLSYWQMIIAGIIIGIFSQIGDLVESLLKRNMNAKDTGHLLPGHGGILDRIDSHLLIAPVAYYLIVLLINQGWLSR